MDPEVRSRVDGWLASRGVGPVSVTMDGGLLLARTDETGFVVDLTTGEERATFRAVPPLAPTPAADGTRFATYDGEAVVIRGLPDGEPVGAFPAAVAANTATGRNPLGPGGDHVYLAAIPGSEWARYDAATGEVEHTYPAVADDEAVACFALSADGSRAAVAGIKSPVSAGFVAVYDAPSGEPVSHDELAYEADRVALSPDGSGVAVVDGIGGLVVDGSRDEGWRDGRWRAADADGVVVDARFVRDGTRVVSVTRSGTLDLWDAATGERVGTHATGAHATKTREHGTGVPAPGVTAVSADDGADLVALSGARARLVAPGWSG